MTKLKHPTIANTVIELDDEEKVAEYVEAGWISVKERKSRKAESEESTSLATDEA